MERLVIDFSVNKNRWQVPDANLDYFASMLQEAQIRVNRGEKLRPLKVIIIFLYGLYASASMRIMPT
jgi:hypothetical protein